MEKKICILFGNCHCTGVRKFLEFSNFYEHYEVYQYANWELLKNREMVIPVDVLRKADLVIYQPLSDVHNCYSTNRNNPDSFFNLLKEGCKTVSFPRIHNNALFPVFHKRERKDLIYGKYNNNIHTKDDMISLYNNNMIDFDFEKRVSINYEISRQKEADCDIKIANFIYANLAKKKCFLTQDHPTSFVFNKLANDICNFLGFEYDYEKGLTMDENVVGLQDSVYHRSSCQYPISRYAIKYFRFEYITEEDSDADEFYKQNLLHLFHVNLQNEHKNNNNI